MLLGAKERGRRDARDVCSALIAGTFRWLWANGYLPDPRVVPWVLVPAPTTRRASRQRGGDLVTRWCQDTAQAICGDITVAPVLRSRGTKRDQVGLSATARRKNLSGAVTVDKREWERHTRSRRASTARTAAHSPQVILVDDVVTTGSTCAESVLVLRAHGWHPAMGVALCSA